MAIRALYQGDESNTIDLRNPGYGFICAVDTAGALTSASTIQIVAETASTAGLDFDILEAAGDDADLATNGINASVAQRVTAEQDVVAATG